MHRPIRALWRMFACALTALALASPAAADDSADTVSMAHDPNRYGIVVSATVFGLMHLQPIDTPALIGFGLVAGWLAARYRRLGPAIFAHVAFNLTAVVALLHK